MGECCARGMHVSATTALRQLYRFRLSVNEPQSGCVGVAAEGGAAVLRGPDREGGANRCCAATLRLSHAQHGREHTRSIAATASHARWLCSSVPV